MILNTLYFQRGRGSGQRSYTCVTASNLPLDESRDAATLTGLLPGAGGNKATLTVQGVAFWGQLFRGQS